MREKGKREVDFLLRAIELAKKGEGHTRPNPPVGAVVVKDGKIIGEGWHKRCGGDHAEVAAIKDSLRNLATSQPRNLATSQPRNLATSQPRNLATSQPRNLATSQPCNLATCTLYVTLEPCSKPGRVGACTDAIIAAGIKRVVYLVPDPNPKNRGKARRALAKHGIECVNAGASRPREMTLVEWGRRLIAPFAKHVTTGLPFVTVKLAMSLDGKICDDYGNARWISSEKSRKRTGALRERVDAIMVGAETVRKDNPSLLSHGKRNDDLIRVVVTHSGKLPKNAQIFTDGAPNETRVFRVGKDAGDIGDVLRQLGKMGVMHVLCEGGLKLARSLAEAGLVDEWITVLAPKVIGSRRIERAVSIPRAFVLPDNGVAL